MERSMVLTVTEQRELERIHDKSAKLNAKVIDSIETFGQTVPVNLALEVRHLTLQSKIIKLNAEIREIQLTDPQEEGLSFLIHRRDDAISRAKEVGRMNKFLKDMSRGGNEIEVTRV